MMARIYVTDRMTLGDGNWHELQAAMRGKERGEIEFAC